MDPQEMNGQSQTCQGGVHTPHIALQMNALQYKQQPNMLQEYGIYFEM